MGLLQQFAADPHAIRYKKVLSIELGRNALRKLFEFFESPDIQRRMIESELHHERPALAGVVKELEALISKQIEAEIELGNVRESESTMRRNQAIGVIVRIVMESKGWVPTGKRGSLTALSSMFKRGERYAPVEKPV